MCFCMSNNEALGPRPRVSLGVFAAWLGGRDTRSSRVTRRKTKRDESVC